MRTGSRFLIALAALIFLGCEARKTNTSTTPGTGAEYFLLRSDEALKRGDYDDALNLALKARQRDSLSAAATFLVGEALHKLGRTSQAEAAFRQTVALDPAFRNAHLRLGNIAYDRGDARAALEFYRMELDGQKSATVWYNFGAAQLKSGRPDSAQMAFEQALRVDPGHVSSHVALSNLKDLDGEIEAAILSAERALSLAPADPHVQKHAGLLYLKVGRTSDALSLLERASNHDLLDSEAHYALGQAYQRLGRPAEAERSFARHEKSKSSRETIDHYRKRLDENPNDRDAALRLARLYLALRHYDDAILHYRALTSSDRNDLRARTELAMALALKGDAAGAEREYRIVLESDPDRADVWMYLGTLLLREGRNVDGEQALARAFELDPSLRARVDSLRNVG